MKKVYFLLFVLFLVSTQVEQSSHAAVSDGSTTEYVPATKNLGVGTSTPQGRLHVSGSVIIEDGTQANGYVLTTNANGGTTWTNPTTISTKHSPAGAAGAVQFNNGSTFGADNGNFFWDISNGRLGISTNDPDADLAVGNGTATYIDGTRDAFIKDDLEVNGTIFASRVNGFILDGSYFTGATMLPGQFSTLKDVTSLFDRNVLANAAVKGDITINITGSGNLNNTTNTYINKMFDGSNQHVTFQSTDASTTKIEITIDYGSTIDAYDHGSWAPFVKYRVSPQTIPIATFYNKITAEISDNGTTWYKPTSGWSTNGFMAAETVPGFWLGDKVAGPYPIMTNGTYANPWRYARFTLEDRVENGGYAFKDQLWLSEIGFRHVNERGAPHYLHGQGGDVYGSVGIKPADNSTTTFQILDNGDFSVLNTNTNTQTVTIENLTVNGLADMQSVDINTQLDLGTSSITNIVAGTGITATKPLMKIQGNGGAVNISANPQIIAGNDGQVLILKGSSDTNTVRINSKNGVELSDDLYFIMGNKDTLMLYYDSTNSEWLEISRSDKT